MPRFSQTASMGAPVGGWNAYNSLSDMPPSDAVTLDNFFPESSYLRLRRGYTQFCATGAVGAVKTLMEYTGGANSKFIACADGKWFDVTSGTASTLATGFGSDIWSFTNYSTGGGMYVIAANASGLDAPQIFNGSTVAAISVTGPTAANLSIVQAHAQRMFYAERNTLKVWYSTAGAYQGALTAFDFGPLCVRGGAIACLGTWTRDNGFGGGDDLFVVVTTMGEVLIYNGTDPSTASAWSLAGRFLLGRPVSGPRSLFRTGPDLVLINEDGYQPLSQYLTIGSTQALQTNLARKIGNAASGAVLNYRDNAGWMGLVYPQGTQIIINVPLTSTSFVQHVVNTLTGAWCRYLNLPAYCWSLFLGKPYFGGLGGKIYRWDTGLADNGSDVVGELVTSFQYIGGRGGLKRFLMARPQVVSSGNLTYSLGIETDFNVASILPTVSSNTLSIGTWGAAIWGTSVWDTAVQAQRRWASVAGLGYAAAVHMKVSTHTQNVAINGFDVQYERGGVL